MIFRPSEASISTHPDWWECRVQILHPLSSLFPYFPLVTVKYHSTYVTLMDITTTTATSLPFTKPSYVVGRALDLSLCKVA